VRELQEAQAGDQAGTDQGPGRDGPGTRLQEDQAGTRQGPGRDQRPDCRRPRPQEDQIGTSDQGLSDWIGHDSMAVGSTDHGLMLQEYTVLHMYYMASMMLHHSTAVCTVCALLPHEQHSTCTDYGMHPMCDCNLHGLVCMCMHPTHGLLHERYDLGVRTCSIPRANMTGTRQSSN